MNLIKLRIKYEIQNLNLNNLKPILGQHGISFKDFELNLKKLLVNFPNNFELNIILKFKKGFRNLDIFVKNLKLNFFILQYFLYLEENNRNYFFFKDLYIIYKCYINLNKKFVNKNFNFSFTNLIGIIKSYNFIIKKINILKKKKKENLDLKINDIKLKKCYLMNSKRRNLKKNKYLIIYDLLNKNLHNIKNRLKKNILNKYFFNSIKFRNLFFFNFFNNFSDFLKFYNQILKTIDFEVFLIVLEKNYICKIFLKNFVKFFKKKFYKYNFFFFFFFSKI